MGIPISQIEAIYSLPPKKQQSHSPESPPQESNPSTQKTIQTLHLTPHIEGGYFVETDRHPLRIPNPYTSTTGDDQQEKQQENKEGRAASSSILYYLTPSSPVGYFHRNRGRTIHALHRGRGRYVIIHADEVMNHNQEDGEVVKRETAAKEKGKARIETFIVGPNIQNGEKSQWVVEGGKFKGCFLLPDSQDGTESEGLLISETVVPGFEYSDHDFLRKEVMEELLTMDQVEELKWLLRG